MREVDVIGPVRAASILAAWAEQKAVREIMVFLHSHGVGTARAVRIFKSYGADAIQVMTENPYRLARDIRSAFLSNNADGKLKAPGFSSAYVIQNGRSVLEGNRQTLLRDPKFTSKFLGAGLISTLLEIKFAIICGLPSLF